ncbi:MAG: 2Fe-2S iron-sulfur cluster-binding protein [Candidatus Thiodiazotropha sp.]
MMDATTYTLRFPHLDREIPTREDETIFQSARRHGVRIVGACGGRGTCGSCVVRIGEGEVSHLNGDATRRKKWQRACQLFARSDCPVEVAPRSLALVVRAEADTDTQERLPLETPLRARDLTLPAASLQDNLADHDRVLRALGGEAATMDLAAARQLPGLLRQEPHASDWSLRVFQRAAELVGFAPAGSPMLGLAIDLGTTNAAGFLLDLETGERLASLGIENPQVAWGADLVSRLNHAVGGEAETLELRNAAIEAINALAHDLCFTIGRCAGDILDVAICGNTAMHHLLLGLPVRQLGRAPFVAAVRHGMDLKARELGLRLAPGARVHVAPNVGGFVGGDHVTALLATEESWSQCETALVMDIGTNTEISLIHQGRFYTASAPSRRATRISSGTRAIGRSGWPKRSSLPRTMCVRCSWPRRRSALPPNCCSTKRAWMKGRLSASSSPAPLAPTSISTVASASASFPGCRRSASYRWAMPPGSVSGACWHPPRRGSGLGSWHPPAATWSSVQGAIFRNAFCATSDSTKA